MKNGHEGAEQSVHECKEEVRTNTEFNAHHDKVIEIMTKFKILWESLDGLSVAKQRIEPTSDEIRLVYCALYRARPKVQKFERTEILKILKMGVTEPEENNWAALVEFAEKYRFVRFRSCYRKLNAVTVQDSYLVPRMSVCIDSLAEAIILFELDGNRGYRHVEIDDRDGDKATFTIYHGLFRFLRVPFGLHNPPGIFQGTMHVIVSSISWQFALVYLNDVSIFSPHAKEYVSHVCTVLSLVQKSDVTLNLKEYNIISEMSDYSVHVIKPGKIEICGPHYFCNSRLKPSGQRSSVEFGSLIWRVIPMFFHKFCFSEALLNRNLKTGEVRILDPLSQEGHVTPATIRTSWYQHHYLLHHAAKYIISLTQIRVISKYTVFGCEDPPDRTRKALRFCAKTLNLLKKNYSKAHWELLAVL